MVWTRGDVIGTKDIEDQKDDIDTSIVRSRRIVGVRKRFVHEQGTV